MTERVFAVGPVDYDQRVGLPQGIYASKETAIAAYPGVIWEWEDDSEDGGVSAFGWQGRVHEDSDQWALQSYDVLTAP